MVDSPSFAPETGVGLRMVEGGRPGPAIRHGDQMEITERFYMNDVGTELTREYTVVDPIYLARPHSHQNTSVLTSDPFLEYNCDDLTVDRYAE